MAKTEIFTPGNFEQENHWYPTVINATIHPMIAYFMELGSDRIAERYCHLHPGVNKGYLQQLMSYRPKYYQLAGTDLLHVTTERGNRQMVVIENNSCPSGQKSMPLLNDFKENGGYMRFIEQTFAPLLKGKRLIEGGLCVVYDKNYMEASGYAQAMSDYFNETVYLIPYYLGDTDHVKWEDNILKSNINGEWKSFRACFRYLTQKPWSRLPLKSKTIIANPIVTCLAGGRNKMLADKAYSMFNSELEENGLTISRPETIWDVNKNEIPFWVSKFGGRAVVKIPYSNAGQGVFTIVNDKELEDFMSRDYEYDQFIVQSLIGNYEWSSTGSKGKFYHVGTVPNAKLESYVLDFRFMIHATKDGYKPLNIYARRAAKPLVKSLDDGTHSWSYLGTNLSFKDKENNWQSDISRLLMMDRKGFNKLGIGFDDLIDGYIQTIMATIAIDKMAISLYGVNGNFKKKLFQSLNSDESLINELM